MALSGSPQVADNHQVQGLPAAEHSEQLRQIHLALQSDALELSFQPILNLQDESQQQYEIRVGFTAIDPDLSSQQAFDLVTQYGLGERIDRWIVAKVVATLERNQTQSCTAPVYIITLTACSLASQSLVSWFAQQVQSITPCRLLVQVSETTALLAHCQLLRFHQSLQNSGIKLSLCHFTGSTESFACLRLLGPGQVQQVKIDPAYFHQLAVKQENRKKLKHLVLRLRDGGVSSVASQVEDITLLPLLCKLGISAVQGYCVQAPGPRQDFSFPQEIQLGTH